MKTAKQFHADLTVELGDMLAKGATLAEMNAHSIRRLTEFQRDALEECANECLFTASNCPEPIATFMRNQARICRALVQQGAAPPEKTRREGGGAGPQQWEKHHAGPCGSTSCAATGPHAHRCGVASVKP